MTAQPGNGLTAKMCPTNPGGIGSIACPIFRGALAVNPLTGDTFAWTVDLYNQDQGLWQDACSLSGGTCSNQTLAFAQRWSTAPLETNSSLGAATIANGDYNSCLPPYPHSRTQFCSWGERFMALQPCHGLHLAQYHQCNHVHGRAGRAVPARNGMESSNSQQVFIGNDSGLWRSTTRSARQDQSARQSMLRIFRISTQASVRSRKSRACRRLELAYTMMAGLGVNGTAGVKSTTGPTSDRPQILSGEGGPVAIDPVSPSNWYVNNSAGVSIHRCSQPGNCTPGDFGTTPMVSNIDVGGDGNTMTSPAPFIVDPLDPVSAPDRHLPSVARAGQRLRLDGRECDQPNSRRHLWPELLQR